MSLHKRPLVLAHRGVSAHATENTLDAFRLAVAHGADGVEFDVRFTSDNVIIVHHDAGVPGYGVFAARSFNELRRELPHVPTLDEVTAVVEDLFINVEIKNDRAQPDFDPDHRMAEVIAEWAKTRTDDTLVSSFNGETIDRLCVVGPGVATGQLFYRVNVTSEIPAVAERGHSWLIPNRRTVARGRGDLVEAAHRYGLRIAVWTVDAPRHLRRLADTGVDAVITNDPRRAFEVYSTR